MSVSLPIFVLNELVSALLHSPFVETQEKTPLFCPVFIISPIHTVRWSTLNQVYVCKIGEVNSKHASFKWGHQHNKNR